MTSSTELSSLCDPHYYYYYYILIFKIWITFFVTGYKSFMEAVEQTSGSVESCVEMMDNEDMLLIYPGGIRELMLGDNNYEVMWRPTAGFAKVAVQAKVATKSRD